MPDTALPHAIYHLNPFAVGPLAGWPAQFERIAALGFDSVALSPPFQADGVFQMRDPTRLHPALGGGDALVAIREMAKQAQAQGLSLLLDLAPHRLAKQSMLLRGRPSWLPENEAEARPPDPRGNVSSLGAVALPPSFPEALSDQWQAWMLEWAQAGIAGFRCLEPSLPGGTFWRHAIAGVRKAAPRSKFIAWTPGTSPDGLKDLADTGFDLAASSLPWWDYTAGWWGEEAGRLAAIAPLLMATEEPFTKRLAAGFRNRASAEQAARRSLAFAAAAGTSWLMPMGFEYGDIHHASQSSVEAPRFEALRQVPYFDLSGAIRDANAARKAEPLTNSRQPAQLLSAPHAPVVLQRRGDKGGRLLVIANPSLAKPAILTAAQLTGLLPEPGSLDPSFAAKGGRLALAPGEVRSMSVQDVAPVQLPVKSGESSARAATEAPRIAIEAMRPGVDEGRFPVKRIVGQPVSVTADIFTDGHGKLAARLLWRPADESGWHEVPMAHTVNDIWAANFTPERVGRYFFAVEAWIDHFAEFSDEIGKKHAAGVKIALERQEGMALLAKAGEVLTGALGTEMAALIKRLENADDDTAVAFFTAEPTRTMMTAADSRPFRLRLEPQALDVERRAAGYASWYEIFPRSQSGSTDRHGTLDDVIRTLPRVRAMGFDVLYFPPIHPIGRRNRKGRNNTLTPGPDDVGSPYAIGAEEGGHDALHPALGTLEDFRRLVKAAADQGLELALDFAIQCSPDHPWLKEHPDWFAYRPDGSIRYAENPPKKYEDIVNVDFYADGAMPSLWIALRDVVLFWVNEGVKLFRVDNPHTKPLPFWEWMIGEVRARHPDVVFLSEAFTRPKVMYRLAKVGFSQSYTYFTWRNAAWEMREYLEELNKAPVSDFFRPHFFVNTPDINPVFLQTSGRPGHLMRAALAATLSGLWGVYNGFELCEAAPVKPGKEEYLDSEKYQIRAWDYDRPGNITGEITMLNRFRRENPALQTHLGTTFLASNHEGILTYVKSTPSADNIVLVAICMDANQPLETHYELPQVALGLPAGSGLIAEDLVAGGEQRWDGTHRYLRLDPHSLPFAIWRLRAADEA